MKRRRSSSLSELKKTAQRSGLRSCSCEGSNDNCRWCGGTGILPVRRETAPSWLPPDTLGEKSESKHDALANIETCDKCSFRGTPAELGAHQLAQHSPSEIDCPKCDFHGTATELRDHLAAYHRPQRGSSSVRKFQLYMCDTCGFRGSEFHVQEHVKQHIVRHYLGWEPPTPPSKKAQAKREQQGKADCRPGYHALTPADR